EHRRERRFEELEDAGAIQVIRILKERFAVPDMRKIMELDASSLHDGRKRPVELCLDRNHARDTIWNGWLDRDERHPAPLGFADESIELPKILLEGAGLDARRRVKIREPLAVDLRNGSVPSVEPCARLRHPIGHEAVAVV